MKWMEVTIFTTEEGLDPVCARLDMLGINQVMTGQRKHRTVPQGYCQVLGLCRHG